MVATIITTIGWIILIVVGALIAGVVAWKLLGFLWAIISDVGGLIFAFLVVGVVILIISRC